MRTIGEVQDDVNDLGRMGVAHTEYCRRQAIAWDFASTGVESLGQLDERAASPEPPDDVEHALDEEAPNALDLPTELRPSRADVLAAVFEHLHLGR